ncbi:replication protein [Citrobacter freundii]|uniref:Replication protein n=1 Tax=Enterobacter asburiae TaxID=61645 RepID=A0A7W3DD64_ENTAS|nr:replication protein [Enterobacter asburiae]MBQ0222264.1 replication protein [Citrobacter freundii]MBS7117266.1 replication protein [Enterobacter cloacae]MBA8076552.1 replication protein [Enterobacter asburiae]MBQ0233265.1 replication protein [Citrobacter freundii]
MGNLATVIPIRPTLTVVERRVADLDDGFTRLANMLLEEYAGADLTKRQFKVLLAVLRLTYGWNKPMDRIANSQIAQIARLPEKRVSEARVQLVGMNLLTQVGRSIGPNKNTAEWLLPAGESLDTENPSKQGMNDGEEESLISGDNPSNQGIPQNEGKSPKSGEAESLNSGEHQRHINTINTNTPQPPEGECVWQEEKPVSKKTPIDYQAVLSAYNTTLGDRLPQAEALNDKRRRAIKRLLTELKEPTVEAVENYFAAFAERAPKFYFGENDRGWRASFDYLLRSDTLLKTREKAL